MKRNSVVRITHQEVPLWFVTKHQLNVLVGFTARIGKEVHFCVVNLHPGDLMHLLRSTWTRWTGVAGVGIGRSDNQSSCQLHVDHLALPYHDDDDDDDDDDGVGDDVDADDDDIDGCDDDDDDDADDQIRRVDAG